MFKLGQATLVVHRTWVHHAWFRVSQVGGSTVVTPIHEVARLIFILGHAVLALRRTWVHHAWFRVSPIGGSTVVTPVHVGLLVVSSVGVLGARH